VTFGIREVNEIDVIDKIDKLNKIIKIGIFMYFEWREKNYISPSNK